MHVCASITRVYAFESNLRRCCQGCRVCSPSTPLSTLWTKLYICVCACVCGTCNGVRICMCAFTLQ